MGPLLLAALLALPHDEPAKPAAYPKAKLLIEPAELDAAIKAGKPPVIFDVRPDGEYSARHVPEAFVIDVAEWAKDYHMFQLGLVAHDINSYETPIVIYDAARSKDAARLWWLLRSWGLTNVRLLNGGWHGWDVAGLPVSKQRKLPPHMAGQIQLFLGSKALRLAQKQEVLSLLKSNPTGIQLIDARSEAEHCGTQTTAKRNGTIPGARHLEWSDLLDKETHRFKSADELRKLFAEARIDLNKPLITYCQSGGRASVMAFALELMGAKDVKNYYASWAEWGNDPDTPIEAGKPKKK